MLGDPAMNNPAVLGAIINSTPIDVGPPGLSPLPGGKEFYDANVNRPYLTYLGASDGMLRSAVLWANSSVNPLLSVATANVVHFDTVETFFTAGTIVLSSVGDTTVGASALAITCTRL